MRYRDKRDSWLGVRAVASLVAVFAFAASSLPAQALEAKAIEGRWRTADDRIVIDIGFCGGKYCGRRVISQNQSANTPCGGTVLTVKLEQPTSDAGSLRFLGNLDLGDRGGAYKIWMDLRADASGNSVSMTLRGWNEGAPIMSRRLPLNVEMVRTGDAVCQATPTS